MRVAIIHYWLVAMRGGEKVLDSLCEIFPEADIFTHVYDPAVLSDRVKAHRISTTFIARMPFARRLYKHYLPLMPMALGQLDLTEYDLVISSEAGPAKGVITRPGSVHICYCHSPMRYIWDQQQIYLRQSGALTRALAPFLFNKLRVWDIVSSFLVDDFVVNSSFVQERVRKFYRRDSVIIHPPVDIDRFTIRPNPSRDYYLYIGQLTPYKQVKIAVHAFAESGRRLIIAGEGEESSALISVAPSNIEFVGRQSDLEVAGLMENCRALIFPAEEDFGIVPVEVMACGRPVIAYASGGAAETVLDGVTGVLFKEQTPMSLNNAIERFEALESTFDPALAKQRSSEFGKDVFRRRFVAHVEHVLASRQRETSALPRDSKGPIVGMQSD